MNEQTNQPPQKIPNPKSRNRALNLLKASLKEEFPGF